MTNPNNTMKTLPASAAKSIIESKAKPEGTEIWDKSPEEVEAAVEALLEQRAEGSPGRKKRHRKIKKQWEKEEKLLNKKHSEPTTSVALKLEASLKKATEQIAELKELQSQIGESLDRLALAGAG